MNHVQFRPIILLAIISLTAAGCKLNQYKNNQRTGRWKYSQQLDSAEYKYSGKYRSGIEKGTWRYFLGDKLVRKEKYKHGIGM